MHRARHQRGMTLIEIMVVIIVIAVLMTGVGLSIGATSRAKLRSSCWTLMSAVRYAYSHAVTQGMTARLVMDFEAHTIRIEATKGRVVLNRDDETGEGLKREDELFGPDGGLGGGAALLNKRMDSIGSGLSGGLGTTEGSGPLGGGMPGLGMGMGMGMGMGTGTEPGEGDMFSMMEGMTSGSLTDPFLSSMQTGKLGGYRRPKFKPLDGRRGEPRELEGSTRFAVVYSPHAPGPIEDGKAYIYFFPGGLTEHTIVQLTDGDDDRTYSVEVHPLTGRSVIHNEPVEPEEDLDDLQEADE